ncbi:MAG: tetratricopeptide repeat protein [Planctomycetota bacterium]
MPDPSNDATFPRRTRRSPREPLDPTLPQRRPVPGAAPAGADPTLPATARAPRARATSAHARDEGQRFVRTGELGRGGLGRVDLADDVRLQREVAIKVLLDTADAESIAEFVEEAQISGQLEHPNIVPVHELGFDARGVPYLVMKRVQGETLADIAAARRAQRGAAGLDALQRDHILEYFLKVCDAMAYVHARGVIHRDLKPANVMVGEFGEVLVMDWGLARPIGAAETGRVVRTDRRGDDNRDLTLDGTVVGTPGYMPPEQADGRLDEMDARADVFALGAILYSLLTGEVPYTGRNVNEVLVKAARHELTPPGRRAPHAGIPRELDAIVMKAMAADRADRYASASELRDDIDALLTSRPVSACTPRLHERLIKWGRRHPAAALGAGMSVLFVALAAAGASFALSQMANAEAARARSEADAAVAEQQRVQAERARRDAELETMAREGRIKDLLRELNSTLAGQRDAAIDAFYAEWKAAIAEGVHEEAFVRQLGAERIQHVISALEQFLATARRLGDDAIPVTSEDFRHLGVLYAVGARDPERALEYLDRALELAPDNAAARMNRGVVLRRLGRPDRALIDLDAAVHAAPRSAEAVYNRGVVKRDLVDLPGAMADFDRALELNPQYADALAQRAFQRYQIGQPGPAFEDATRAIELDSGLAEAQLVVALVEVTRGHIEPALEACNRAIEADPESPTPYVYRAIVQRIRRLPDAAIADCNEAIARNAKVWSAYFQRALAYSQRGDAQASLDDYNRAIDLAPTNPELYLNRGILYSRAGDRTAAYHDYQRCLQINPRQWQAMFNLSPYHVEMGDTDGAIDLLRKAWAICTAPADKARVAEALRKLGAQVPD